MTKLTKQKITKAVITVFETDQKSSRYDSVYGGETLLNRALIALSKAGIQQVFLLTRNGHGKQIESGIGKVRNRIKLTCTVTELASPDHFLTELNQTVSEWDEPFLMFELDSIYHATLFQSILDSDLQDTPVLYCYKGVSSGRGAIQFEETVKEKFKIVFQCPDQLTNVVKKGDRVIFPDPLSKRTDSPDPEDGVAYFSTDVLVCRKENLRPLPSVLSMRDVLSYFEKKNQLNVGWVENVWWLKIVKDPSKDYVKNYLWKIAFKEISGEFSKKFNSILSKPLSFAFARLGFTPNVISIIAFLFLIGSSLLLLVESYWMLVLSGFLWQMAAVLDRCDGEVARIRSYESEFGAQFDIITDDLGYAVQAFCLVVVCYAESQHNLLYLGAFFVTFSWILMAVLHEKKFMKAVGYMSRQVKHVDFLKRLSDDSLLVKLFKKVEVFGRRDWRAVLYFLLAFSGSKNLIFWIFLCFGWILGILVYLQIHILQKYEGVKKKNTDVMKQYKPNEFDFLYGN